MVGGRHPDMAADKRQILVCINCRSRKKKCDKGLPSCGYCVQKRLKCAYSRGTTHRQDDPFGTPERNEAAVPEQIGLSSILGTVLSRPEKLEISVHAEVNRLIRSTGQFVDDITARYFKDVHIFLPVIARSRFHNGLINLGAPPSADLSILLLCMCLVTPNPESRDSSSSSKTSQHTIYLSARSIFAQLQALISPSVSFIQAGLLLAVYEYVHGQSDRGLGTISNSARMAYAARIHTLNVNLRHEEQTSHSLQPEEREALNTWWALIIWERIMMLEVNAQDQPLVTSVRAENAALPTEPDSIDRGGPMLSNTPVPKLLVSTPHEVNVGGFGRLAQAIMLVDQILKAFSICDVAARLSALHNINTSLQSFLGVVVKQHSGRPSSYCSAVVIAIRSLLSLHGHIIQLTSATTAGDGSHADNADSFAAIRTGIAMTLDIAEWHSARPPHMGLMLPPNYVYLLRAALSHMEHNSLLGDGNRAQESRKCLERSLAQFGSIWGQAG
ncbi:unnamed protein product [Clonostachys rhizophaga]|uniref:Zn(2)-C6 fungal-type domain-containing protein n=1 Tax=Clonostachys rhizophaga TaxID=160324 RepID=A0A9N9VNE0_9HYPO|nr:unnamed protein product [Clonostachys rhizophaga]